MRPGGFNAETRVSRAPPTQLIRTRTIWFWQEVQPNFFLLGPGSGVAPAAGAPLLTSCFTRVVGCLSRSSVDGRIVAAAGGESCAESSYVLGWFLSASGPRALGCLAMAGSQWRAASRRAPMVNVRFPSARRRRGARGPVLKGRRRHPRRGCRPHGTARPGRRRAWSSPGPALPEPARDRGLVRPRGGGVAVPRGHGVTGRRGRGAAAWRKPGRPTRHPPAGRPGAGGARPRRAVAMPGASAGRGALTWAAGGGAVALDVVAMEWPRSGGCRYGAFASPRYRVSARRSTGPRWCASASCRCDAGWQRGARGADLGGRGVGRWRWMPWPWSGRGPADAATASRRYGVTAPPRHRAAASPRHRAAALPRCPRVNGWGSRRRSWRGGSGCRSARDPGGARTRGVGTRPVLSARGPFVGAAAGRGAPDPRPGTA